MTNQESRQEEKAYMHWLYQAVGMGNHRFIQEAAKMGKPQRMQESGRKGGV